MLKVIEDEGIIKRCQRQLVRSLRPYMVEKFPVRLGHQGASFPIRVSWSEELRFWFCSRKIGDSRYWNAFGVEKPGGASSLPITCEINFPLKGGIDRKLGGALAEDGHGGIYVVHRGKIGGGKRGVGKALFDEHYQGVRSVIDDGDTESIVALVGMLKSLRFPRQLGQFVRKIAYIKRQADLLAGTQLTIFDDTTPREEFMGQDIETVPLDPGALCDYGLVVKDLADLLASRGVMVRNDRHRELFVVDDRGREVILFQIIPDSADTSIHAGIGRLMLLGADLPVQPEFVLVVPENPVGDIIEKLKRMKILVLAYEWQGAHAVFPGIDGLLSFCS